MTAPLQHRYFALVDEIERTCAVAQWRWRDVDLWPMARMDLFLDMFRRDGGDTAPPPPPFIYRATASLAVPLTNLWKSRHDLRHRVARPHPCYAVMLGDGVSLDKVDGAWQDRFGEPLIAALAAQGRETFLMQPGNLTRLPWRRPTFAANVIAGRGALMAACLPRAEPELPDFGAVLALVAEHGVAAPSLARPRLARRARVADATATAFQRVLRRARPHLAFVVTYYAGLGHAFALACRREKILCVDLQHCPQDGTHKAYRWGSLPKNGYTTLPALFWTWHAADAAAMRAWGPWHRGLHGGHAQIASFLDDADPTTRGWDRRFAAIGDGTTYDREILVALQPIGGQRRTWDALAEQIDRAPANWRWWIRRHPSSTPDQDGELGALLALRRTNVVVEAAGALPLPALLRRMSVLVSLMSGAAGEAAVFGVPALFLDPAAGDAFAGLIERGQASVVDVAELIPAVTNAIAGSISVAPPPIETSLLRLHEIASEYAKRSPFVLRSG